jgi:hypothetical protein
MAKRARIARLERPARHRHDLSSACHHLAVLVDDLEGVETCPEVSGPLTGVSCPLVSVNHARTGPSTMARARVPPPCARVPIVRGESSDPRGSRPKVGPTASSGVSTLWEATQSVREPDQHGLQQ